uniref:Uncharacterized protein n=1 Tax=Setaria italica TaxID=4555 RepID=K3Z1N5_SETIT
MVYSLQSKASKYAEFQIIRTARHPVLSNRTTQQLQFLSNTTA